MKKIKNEWVLLIILIMNYHIGNSQVSDKTYNGSHIGEAVFKSINDLNHKNIYSKYTNKNNIPENWLWSVYDVNSEPSNDRAIAFYKEIGRMLSETKYTFELSSLWFRESYGSFELVKKYLAPALKTLHEASADSKYKPYLRFMYSLSSAPKEFYEVITSELPKDESTWNINIKVGTIISPNGWNHSKIAVRDRQEAMVGGQNWEKTTYIDGNYFKDNPNSYLHDLNMLVEGETAAAASDYFIKVFNSTVIFCESNFRRILCDTDPSHYVPAPYATQQKNIFTLGRGFYDRLGTDLEQSADRAVYDAIDATKSSIYISQHQISLLSTYTETFLKKIVEAVLRDVQVKLIISHKWGGIGEYSNVYQSLRLHELLEDHMDNDNFSEEKKAHFRNNLRIAEFRATPNRSTPTQTFFTHNKFLMFDETAFYISSQNMYPTGIENWPNQSFPGNEHNEFGLFVDDKQLSEVVLNEFWNVVWSESQFDGLPNPGKNVGLDNLKLILPNGATTHSFNEEYFKKGEIWYKGTIQPIQWEANTIGNVNISLHRRVSEPEASISANEDNDGNTSYIVQTNLPEDNPNEVGVGTYRVKIASNNNRLVYDLSDGDVYIANPPTENLQLTAPNGGHTYHSNTDLSITWTNIGDLEWKTIELFKGGQLFAELGAGTFSSFTWTIPETIPSGTDYWIRVRKTFEVSDDFKYYNYDTSDDYFSIQSGTPFESQHIFSFDNEGSEFGFDVEINGNRAIIGEPSHHEGGRGHILAYNPETQEWEREVILNLDNVGDGAVVDIDNDVAMLLGGGPAYIYRKNGNQWNRDIKIERISGNSYQAGAIEGNLAVIGAPEVDGSIDNIGAIYTYKWDGNNWNEVNILYGNDSMFPEGLSRFGSSIEISGNKVLVRSEDSVFFLKWNTSTNTYTLEHMHENVGTPNFPGQGVSIHNNQAIIGSTDIGKVYIFKYEASEWILDTELSGNAVNNFGHDVSIEDDLVIIGEPYDSNSVHIFKRDHAGWYLQETLHDNNNDFYSMGHSVGLSNGIMITGIPYAYEGNSSCGAVYLYNIPETSAQSKKEKYSKTDNLEKIAELNSDALDVIVYPNPFSSEVKFLFALNKTENVEVHIYDINGRNVHHINGKKYPKGNHTIHWNLRDNSHQIRNGFYTYEIRIGQTKKKGKILYHNQR